MSPREDLLERALEAIDDLEARLRASREAAREPLAVIGMSCRFPGADDPAALWRLLVEGVDAIRPFPSKRWMDIGRDPPSEGDTALLGGFIDDIAGFDPAFFGISPREATTMDPQQRLALEGAWLALEDAGVAPDTLLGSSTGVFVGITTSDYGQLTRGVSDDVYLATGAALNAASGRISYVLGLQGPCMSVDTACSSSLVALHAACLSLRAGDCDLALVVGVNAILLPDAFQLFSRWGMLAPDGRCKTFDAAADGFSRGEGCGVLVLKRLSDARAGNDRIRALVRGSAVNQDGASSGLSVPNGPAQEKVLRRALAVAGIAPADVDYVEAHGTGTVLGDPIEVEALAAVYGQGRPADRPLRIGSVKTNIGHLESASGVAGVCKAILSLQHEAIPPHLHFREPNPRIAWTELPLAVPVVLTPWSRGDRPRRAGVSSFGFTGTNAHVVLEEAPERTASPPAFTAPALVVPVSGLSTAALRHNARRYSDAMGDAASGSLPELSRTAACGRNHFAHRASVVAATREEAATALIRVAERDDGAAFRAAPRIAFLFSGQGAQRPGMGRELYESSPVFQSALDRCAQICEHRMSVPLLEALFAPGPDSLRDTAVTQPSLFALEYSLAALWASWGIRPAAVLGHSLGEYVAACVAGAMELEEALRLVVDRGRLMAELPQEGAMVAVFASADDVRALVEDRPDDLSIAAVNGPDGTVVSGRRDAVDEIRRRLQSRGVESRPLDVSHAFHSPLMEPILGRLEELARRVSARPPRIPLAANLDGEVVANGRVLDARYWRRQARETVQFGPAVRALRELGCDTFVEIGPASTLLGLVRRVVGTEGVASIPSLGSEGEWRVLMQALGRLYDLGASVDWDAVTSPYATRSAQLPGYAFDRRHFWVDASRRSVGSHLGASRSRHPLLGTPLDVAGDDLRVWASEISLDRLPFLGDHRVQGAVIVPATAYLEIGFAAAVDLVPEHGVRLTGLVNEKPLILRTGDRYLLQTRLSKGADERWRFEVYARDPSDGTALWDRHVRGELSAWAPPDPPRPFDAAAIQARCPRHITAGDFYRRLAEKGNQWGPAFQSMVEAWIGEGEAIARVDAAAPIADDLKMYRFHPALADSAGHVMVATRPLDTSASATGGALVGGGTDEVRLYRSPSAAGMWAHATLTSTEGPENVITGDVRVYDQHGALVSEALGARLWYLDEEEVESGSLFFDVAWKPSGPVPPLDTSALSETWCLLADDAGVAHALSARLREAGRRVVVVRPASRGPAASDELCVRPLEDRDWDLVLAALNEDANGPHAVMHLWSQSPESGVERDSVFTEGAAALSAITRAIVRSGASARLWIATAGAQPVGGRTVTDPKGAALWGFGRALAVEHRELWGGLIDLDPEDSPAGRAEALLSLASSPETERCVGVRQGTVHAPRLRSIGGLARRRIPGEPGATLISGGMGGIGLEVAKRLVERGCSSLVLIGRRTPPSEGEDERWGRVRDYVESFREQGAEVRLEAVDVTDSTAVTLLAERLRRDDRVDVRRVLHAAGVMHYGPVTTLDAGELRSVLAAKVQGAQNLVQAFRPDSVVFFSSASSLLPSPLMAGYAAGNAFLDAYAHALRDQGVEAVSVNWGTWAEVGMATRFAGREQGAVLTGLRTLGTRRALDALEAVISSGRTQVGVMRMDWPAWRRLYPDFVRDPFFEDVIGGADEGDRSGDIVDLAALPTLDIDGQRALLSDYLAGRVGRILGLDVGELDRKRPINLMGFDSLMALETKNRIESDLDVLIPMVRLLEGPSIDEVVEDLLAIGAGAGPGRPSTAPQAELVEGEI